MQSCSTRHILFGSIPSEKETQALDTSSNETVYSPVFTIPHGSGLSVHLWATDAGSLDTDVILQLSNRKERDDSGDDEWEDERTITTLTSGALSFIDNISNIQTIYARLKLFTNAGSGTVQGVASHGKEY